MNVSRRSFLSRVAAAFAGVAAALKIKVEPPPTPRRVSSRPTVLTGFLSSQSIDAHTERLHYNWWEKDPIKLEESTRHYPKEVENWAKQFGKEA